MPASAALDGADETASVQNGSQVLSSCVSSIKASTRAHVSGILHLAMGCLLCLALSGCTTSGFFSLREKAPNAYDVTTESLLAMPPGFDRLPKPTLGAPPTQRTDSAQSAEALLDPQAVIDNQNSLMTQGQKALLEAAGPLPRNTPAELDRAAASPTVVDTEAEWRRIEEDAALGKPVTTGKTPVVKGHDGGILSPLSSWF